MPHLSEAVEDPDGGSDARAEHVRQEEVDAAALHLAALTDADGAQRRHERHADRHQDYQHREADPCVALETGVRVCHVCVLY